MKETLHRRINSMIDRLDKRIKQLNNHIEEYKFENNFEDAMKNKIKRDQLEMVWLELKRALEN